MKRVLVILAIILAFFPVSSRAARPQRVDVSLQSVIETIEAPHRVTLGTGLPLLETVEADFVQRTVDGRTKREMRGEGRMHVRFPQPGDPLMFRFEYYRPTRQEIVLDGSVLWMYLPDDRKVIRSEMEGIFPGRYEADRDRSVTFLQALGKISRDFTITFADQSVDMAGNYILELRPRRSMPAIERMLLVVSREAVLARSAPARHPYRPEHAFPILSSTVWDHAGNMTTLEFHAPIVNRPLPEIFFSFVPPATADVVRPPY